MDVKVQMESMEEHLLFHKAMAEDEETFEKINGYLSILREETSGEKLQDPMDESVRAIFSLVIEKGMDPWAINLEEFARLYSEKVSNDRFDMLVAGRLLLMAWTILKLQSDETRRSADTPEVEEDLYEETDFTFEDESPVVLVDVKLDKAISRDAPRQVTMIELIQAFAEAQEEAAIIEARNETITRLKSQKPRMTFDNKAHKEDDESVVEAVYQRIYALGMDPMPITEFYSVSKEDNITVFVSILHLVRDGKLDVFQESLPYGEIMVQIRQPDAASQMETAVAVN